MTDDLAAQRAKNSAGFFGESPPETKPDPLTAQHQALVKRLQRDRVKENADIEAAQRKAFAAKPTASKPVKPAPKAKAGKRRPQARTGSGSPPASTTKTGD